MGSVNKVMLLGNLGQDPELKMTQGGQQVCTLSIATSESWQKDGKREERTEWHRVVLWGKLAELAGRYLKKGRRVFIEGKIQTRSWDDQNGQKRYSTEVIATNMVFVDAGNGSNDAVGTAAQPSGGYNGPATPTTGSQPPGYDDSDVPF